RRRNRFDLWVRWLSADVRIDGSAGGVALPGAALQEHAAAALSYDGLGWNSAAAPIATEHLSRGDSGGKFFPAAGVLPASWREERLNADYRALCNRRILTGGGGRDAIQPRAIPTGNNRCHNDDH